MKPMETVDVWLDRVWVQEDAGAIDDMLVEDTRALGLDKDARVGPEEFKEFHSCLLGLIKDIKFNILRQREEDDGWVSTLFELNAKRRDNGKPVSTTGHIYGRISDGKIREGYNHVDFIRLFEQLDLMPENCFGTCLQGQKVA